jgi:hypothetical protein
VACRGPVLLVLLLGCGSAGTSTDGGAVAADASGYGPACPATAPTGGACAREGQVCTYGDSPRIECRIKATCTGGQWSVASTPCPTPAPPGQCPTTTPRTPTPCDSAGRTCRFADGAECLCFANPTLVPPMWLCNLPLALPGACPPTSPNAGATCPMPTSCTYACGPLSSQSVNASCKDGVWELVTTPCAQTGG